MLTPGSIVGRDFRVVRLLREGGMGAVYIAEQMSIRETRALKVMRVGIPGLEDPERLRKYRERFLEEAAKSSGLRSAHVVKVVASGIDEATNTPWLAMELLRGEDLDAVLQRRGLLPWGETLQLFEQVGHGLSAAHRAGVLHLDLKPENIFVAEPESPGTPFSVKILDFGIGRVLEEHRTSVTATTAVGSPLWMSPEQALKQQLSASTDVWPLGLIAYRCLTGRHYWREANKSAEEFAPTGWILELMTHELVPASARAREQGVEALLPVGFDAWFARCVSREREARWQSVDEMLQSLRGLLGGAANSSVAFAATAPFSSASSGMAGTMLSPDPRVTVPPTMVLTDGSPGLVSLNPFTSSAAAQSAPRGTRPVAVVAVVLAGLVVVGGGWLMRSRIASGTSNATPGSAAARNNASDATPNAPGSADATATPAAGVLECPDGFVLIRGRSASVPRYPSPEASTNVSVATFCIQANETSADEYRACVESGAEHACPAETRDRHCNYARPGRGGHPLDCAHWESAVAWCAWRVPGGRLPTNAEWTLAAYGGTRRFPWGDDPSFGPVCWTEGMPIGQQRPHTCPVADFGVDTTPEDVRNLGGGIEEWTSDECHFVGGSEHVTRGRAWPWRASDPEVGCWGVEANAAPPIGPLYVGFRCAVAPTERVDGATDR